jgi:hypothetical protein
MATIAVVIALGGTSYAAIKVTGKNVKNSSLTRKDIKNSSFLSSDVRNGSLSPATSRPLVHGVLGIRRLGLGAVQLAERIRHVAVRGALRRAVRCGACAGSGRRGRAPAARRRAARA